MYRTCQQDRLAQLNEIPDMNRGAPCPIVLRDEWTTVVGFYLATPPTPTFGIEVRVVSPSEAQLPICIVSFHRCMAVYSGPPGTDDLGCHPLADRGLRRSSAYEVVHSSWIDQLMRRPSVNSDHGVEVMRRKRHFILTFHDFIFECIADDLEVMLDSGCLAAVVPKIANIVFGQ